MELLSVHKGFAKKGKKRQFELVILGRKHSHDFTAVPVGP